MISPHRVSRFATGTSHGYPTDVPPGRARKSSVVWRGTTRGRGTLQSGNHRPSDMTIDIDGETELPLLCDMLS